MPRISIARALLLASLLGACTPTYDWREIRFEPPGLAALLPCKPDRGTRTVPLGGQPVALAMQGCEREGATFAVAWADLGDAARVPPALQAWREGALAQLGAVPQDVSRSAFVPPGAAVLPESMRVQGRGSAQGRPLVLRAAWFARGSQVFQVIVVGERVPEDVAETFFGGVRLR